MQTVGGSQESTQTNMATYPADHLSVPFVGAVGVTVARVKGQRITRLPGEAARCLVAVETRFAGAALVGTLRDDSRL